MSPDDRSSSYIPTASGIKTRIMKKWCSANTKRSLSPLKLITRTSRHETHTKTQVVQSPSACMPAYSSSNCK